MEIIKEERKSGLIDTFDGIFKEVDYNDFMGLYSSFGSNYGKQYSSLVSKFCYLVTYTTIPGLLYVAFESNKDRAKGTATKYFKLSKHPEFDGNKWRFTHINARAILKRDWDKYAMTGKIPVMELLDLGASFPCYCCGRGLFTYNDLKKKKCCIVEGEGELNPFTQGFLICKECEKKYFG